MKFCLVMPALSKNALEILRARYFLRNRAGEILETPGKMFRRVANAVATGEDKNKTHWQQRYYAVMNALDFLPNSPTLMNAGLPKGQLSACFVLPVQDSLHSIFDTLKNAALIHQSGGGTGFNFSRLRPKDDQVSSSGGTSSGPIAFMKIFDAATEYVKQGGRRRGANMGILNIDHPDVEEFIESKSDGKQLQNFNISVGITDAFMKALNRDGDWELVNPRPKKVTIKVRAVYLWNQIISNDWQTGDPGLVFLDTINRSNPTPEMGPISSTNPCGEVPLLDYESCNLGSVNLANMIKEVNGKPEIDWDHLGDTVETGIRFLDNIIRVNHYLLPETEKISLENRKIGLGVMGWADLLIQLDIPYASSAAVALAGRVMEFIQTKSHEASARLAEERGVFPQFSHSVLKVPLRNATCNSIAPTGTISVIAGTSYSIEPLFALAFKRTGILNNSTQVEVNQHFIKRMEALDYWDPTLKKEILKTGSVQQIGSLPIHLKEVFKTSLEIPWKYHLLHQQAFQKYTDNAVSKTINLPESTTLKEISEIYRTAWEYELKGITIYRQGSKDKQVIQRCNYNTLSDCDT